MQNGQRLTESRFSDQFDTVMAGYCGCSIKPRSYRQAAIGIGREYMPPHLHIEHGSNAVLDEASHHGTSIARAHYLGLG